MKRSELLNMIDKELLDRLFGYCYHRTANSCEASELCSDIVYALVKAANTEGELDNAEAFVWRIAHNVYADYAKGRKRAPSTAMRAIPTRCSSTSRTSATNLRRTTASSYPAFCDRSPFSRVPTARS